MDRGKLFSFVFKITLLNVKLCLEGLDEKRRNRDSFAFMQKRLA